MFRPVLIPSQQLVGSQTLSATTYAVPDAATMTAITFTAGSLDSCRWFLWLRSPSLSTVCGAEAGWDRGITISTPFCLFNSTVKSVVPLHIWKLAFTGNAIIGQNLLSQDNSDSLKKYSALSAFNDLVVPDAGDSILLLLDFSRCGSLTLSFSGSRPTSTIERSPCFVLHCPSYLWCTTRLISSCTTVLCLHASSLGCYLQI